MSAEPIELSEFMEQAAVTSPGALDARVAALQDAARQRVAQRFAVDGTLAQILELLYDRSAEVVMLQHGIAGLSRQSDAAPE